MNKLTTIRTWWQPTWKELAIAIPTGSTLIWFITDTLNYLVRCRMKFVIRFTRSPGSYWYLKIRGRPGPDNPGYYWYGRVNDAATFDTENAARAAWKQFVMAEKREMPAAFQDWWNNAFVVPITEHGEGSPTPV